MRQARTAEIETILDWAAAEGWNPGIDDAAAFHAADPEGFFVAERDGRPVAAISVVNHSDSFAFLGLYLCLPEWRGQGIGYALWQHALEHAGTRTVGLDGVATQQGNYRKSGFVPAGASLRFEGALSGRPAKDTRPAEASDIAAMLVLDRAATGYDRRRFLGSWFAATTTRQTLVTHENGGLTGFVTARRCRDGIKLGPIVAPDPKAGLRLTRAALSALPSDTAIIDVPEENAGLAQLLVREGFRQTFATARMYRGQAPRSDRSCQAIATMELG